MEENRLSFGCELEWSDVDRRVDIPEELGSWEGPKIAGYYMGSEIDIVNTKGEWKGHGTDPLCLDCKVGGEIHTQPSETIDTQMFRVMRIMDLFSTICVACPNHGHIHVGIKGIKNDLQALKNLFAYTQLNEADLIRECCGYSKDEEYEIGCSDVEDWVKSYLLVGDGKSINPDLYAQVAEAESVSEIMKLLEETPCDDWYWVSDVRDETSNSHRTAFNLFNLTKGGTVEFRIFRATTNPVELYSSLYFAKRYVEEALKGLEGKSVKDILKEGNFKFAKLNFDEELAKGWQETRQTKGRCGCFKHYTGTCIASEDPVLYSIDHGMEYGRTAFEEGLLDILKLVKLDFKGKVIE